MTHDESRFARAVQRAFEGARSGLCDDLASIERKLAMEGFGEDIDSPEWLDVKRALEGVLVDSHRLQLSAEHVSI